MDWIALRPSHEGQWLDWGWQALRFTPRVARVEDAVLLEASASLRDLSRLRLQEGQGLADWLLVTDRGRWRGRIRDRGCCYWPYDPGGGVAGFGTTRSAVLCASLLYAF